MLCAMHLFVKLYGLICGQTIKFFLKAQIKEEKLRYSFLKSFSHIHLHTQKHIYIYIYIYMHIARPILMTNIVTICCCQMIQISIGIRVYVVFYIVQILYTDIHWCRAVYVYVIHYASIKNAEGNCFLNIIHQNSSWYYW